MELEEWRTVQGIGRLSVEQELIFGNEPVLFVCISEQDTRYLVMTMDSLVDQYAIAEIDDSTLLGMLNNEISIREALLFHGFLWITAVCEDGMLKTNMHSAWLVDDSLLPRKDVMLEAHSKEIEDYRNVLEKRR
jgi:hypothetical protein